MFAGLDRFDRETGNWIHYRHDPDDPGSLSNDWVSAIFEDHSGVLWVGTRSGLDRFDPQTDSAIGDGTFTHYQADPDGSPRSRSNDITAIYQGQDGDLWIGTEDGLYIFDREKESWGPHYRHDPGDPESLSNVFLSILEDRDGILWIGTLGGGLDRFDPEKETIAHYQNDPGNPHSLSNDFILFIFQDREGVFWISTFNGLDKFDQASETFTHYRKNDGMPNDTEYCILEDGGGNLWLKLMAVVLGSFVISVGLYEFIFKRIQLLRRLLRVK